MTRWEWAFLTYLIAVAIVIFLGWKHQRNKDRHDGPDRRD